MPKLQSFAEFVDMCLSLTLSTYQNRDEFDSEPWAEKGTGHLINSNLKKIIQTELTIIPPTEVHETRFARDTTSWSPTPRSDSWPYEVPDLWFVCYSVFPEEIKWLNWRGIKWSHPIWKCSRNLAFARIARKNSMSARLLTLAKLLQLLACLDFH